MVKVRSNVPCARGHCSGKGCRVPVGVFTHLKCYRKDIVHSNDIVTEGTMPAEEEMNIDERFKYLRMVQKRYRLSNRSERNILLDEMEQITGLHRKSLIRSMKSILTRQRRRRQRGRTYGIEVHIALKVISESFDFICAERLQPNLVWMAEHLTNHGELETSPKLLRQLECISTATVGRILQRLGQDQPHLPRKGPVEANSVARKVPIRRIPWHEERPGHFEVDLVHHSGPKVDGCYVHTLQMIDVATGWSERVATLGRSYLVMEDGFHRILGRLPFPVREIHSDNGGEFLNDHMLRFWPTVDSDIQLSRSRPYIKNDNRFVEQKNATLVRAYLGYQRLDSAAQTNALNQLFDKMWLYYNFFQPVMRLVEKMVVSEDDQPPRFKRRYDQAQTPFDRLCATAILNPTQFARLNQLRIQTNPRRLRQEIYDMIHYIFSLSKVAPGQSDDVRITLLSSTQQSMQANHLAIDLFKASNALLTNAAKTKEF